VEATGRLLVYHSDGQGTRACRRHQKNGRRWRQPLKEEFGEGGFLEIRFCSRDTCSIGCARVLGWQASWAMHCGCAAWAMNESGEVGQPGRKGRGGPGQASQLARLGQKLKENSFSNKNWIFEYIKALKICRRIFRRNFDMEIFPKFF
jgi:hypothetical protein